MKNIIQEWFKTFSMEKSFLSSKKIERFGFVSVSISLVVGTFIFLVVKDRLVASDTIILISPLLLAAGYNLTQTEKSKPKKDEGNIEG